MAKKKKRNWIEERDEVISRATRLTNVKGSYEDRANDLAQFRHEREVANQTTSAKSSDGTTSSVTQDQDSLTRRNQDSYQRHIISTLGRAFNGQKIPQYAFKDYASASKYLISNGLDANKVGLLDANSYRTRVENNTNKSISLQQINNQISGISSLKDISTTIRKSYNSLDAVKDLANQRKTIESTISLANDYIKKYGKDKNVSTILEYATNAKKLIDDNAKGGSAVSNRVNEEREALFKPTIPGQAPLKDIQNKYAAYQEMNMQEKFGKEEWKGPKKEVTYDYDELKNAKPESKAEEKWIDDKKKVEIYKYGEAKNIGKLMDIGLNDKIDATTRQYIATVIATNANEKEWKEINYKATLGNTSYSASGSDVTDNDQVAQGEKFVNSIISTKYLIKIKNEEEKLYDSIPDKNTEAKSAVAQRLNTVNALLSGEEDVNPYAKSIIFDNIYDLAKKDYKGNNKLITAFKEQKEKAADEAKYTSEYYEASGETNPYAIPGSIEIQSDPVLNFGKEVVGDIAYKPVNSAYKLVKSSIGDEEAAEKGFIPEIGIELEATTAAQERNMPKWGKHVYETGKFLFELAATEGFAGELGAVVSGGEEAASIAATGSKIASKASNIEKFAKKAGHLWMATNSAGEAYDAALKQGASNEEARTYGIATGVANYLIMNKIFGKTSQAATDAIQKDIASQVVENAYNPSAINIEIGAKDIAKGALKNAVSSGLKTGAQMTNFTVANRLTDIAAQQGLLGENSVYSQMYHNYINEGMPENEALKKLAGDLAINLAEEMGTSAISGFGFGAVSGVTNTFGNREFYQREANRINKNAQIAQEAFESPVERKLGENKYFDNVNTTEELNKQFKQYSKELHPDQNPSDAGLFSDISAEKTRIENILKGKKVGADPRTEAIYQWEEFVNKNREILGEPKVSTIKDTDKFLREWGNTKNNLLELRTQVNSVEPKTPQEAQEIQEASYDIRTKIVETSKAVAEATGLDVSTNIEFKPDSEYTPEQLRVKDEYIYAVNPELKLFFENIRDGVETKKYQKIGEASHNEIKSFKLLTGANVSGYKRIMMADDARHINNGHGQMGNTDHSMSNSSDVARAEYIIENPDNVCYATDKKGNIKYSEVYKNKNGKRTPELLFIKQIDGTCIVVEAASDSKDKRVGIISEYSTKKNVQQVTMDNIPESHALDELADTFNLNVSELKKNVNEIYKKTAYTIKEGSQVPNVDNNPKLYVRNEVAQPSYNSNITSQKSSVKLDNLTDRQAEIAEKGISNDMSDDAVKAMVTNDTQSVSPEEYANGFNMYYILGKDSNIKTFDDAVRKMEELGNGHVLDDISIQAAGVAFSKGKEAVPKSEVKAILKKKPSGTFKADFEVSNINEKYVHGVLENVAKLSGADVLIVENFGDYEELKNVPDNTQGLTISDEGKVILQRDVANILGTEIHEVVGHLGKQFAQDAYSNFVNIVEKVAREDLGIKGFDKQIKDLITEYRKAGQEISYEEAREEAIAYFAETMMLNPEVVEKFVKKTTEATISDAQKKNIIQIVLEWIKNAIKVLKNRISNSAVREGTEGMLREELVDANEIVDSMIKVFEESKNYFENAEVKDSPVSSEKKYSLVEGKLEEAINTSMSQEEANTMLEYAYRHYAKDMYDSFNEFIKEDSQTIALYVESVETIWDTFLNGIDGLEKEDFTLEDIIDAYKEGTLKGNDNNNTVRLNTSAKGKIKDVFYSPKEIENIKEVYKTANERVTNNNRNEIYNARKEILFYSHNEKASQELGISKKELNQKLRNWSHYSSRAKEMSQKINEGVSLENRWTGIENSSYISRGTVTNEEIESVVNKVIGTGNDYEKKAVGRTILALDTTIDWSQLVIDFKNTDRIVEPTVLGEYNHNDKTLTIKGDLDKTVAHELGHALDNIWGQELFGKNVYLSHMSKSQIDKLDGKTKQWAINVFNFTKNLLNNNDKASEYTMQKDETFARFVERFVMWTERLATGRIQNTSEYSWFNDNFTQGQFVEFAKLLQEKASLNMKSAEQIEKVDSSVKYSLSPEQKDKPQTLIDEKGDRIVVIGNKTFSRKGVKKYHKEVAKTVKNMLRELEGKTVTIKDNNTTVTFDKITTGEYLYSQDTRKADNKRKTAKYNAVNELEGVVENAKYKSHAVLNKAKEQAKLKRGIDASNGFDYYGVKFAFENSEGNYNVFSGVLNVRLNRNNKGFVYDITKVSETVPNGIKPISKAPVSDTSDRANLSDNRTNVKSQKSIKPNNQEKIEKYSQIHEDIGRQLKLVKGSKLDSKQTRSIALGLKKKLGSKMDTLEVSHQLNSLFTLIENKGGNINNTDVMDKAHQVVRDVMKEAKEPDPTYMEIVRGIRKTPIYLSEKDKAQIPDYPYFRKASFGKFRFVNDNKAVAVDEFFKELEENHPDVYSSIVDKEYPDASTLLDVSNWIDAVKDDAFSLYDMEGEQAVDYYVLDLLNDYSNTKVEDITNSKAKQRELYKNIGEMVDFAKEQQKTINKQEKEFVSKLNQKQSDISIRLDEQKRELQDSYNKTFTEELSKTKEKYNEREAKKIAKLKAQQKERLKKYSEDRKRTEKRQSIRKTRDRVKTTITKPTVKKYIPKTLQRPVAELFNSIDLGEQYSISRLNKMRDNAMIKYQGRELEDKLSQIDAQEYKFTNKLKEFKDSLERYVKDAEDDSDTYFAPVIKLIEDTIDKVGTKSLMKMTSDELNSVSKTLRAIEKSTTERNRPVTMEFKDENGKKIETYEEAAKLANNQLSKTDLGKLTKAITSHLTGRNTIMAMGGWNPNSIHTQIANQFDDAYIKESEIKQRLHAIIDPVISEKKGKTQFTTKAEDMQKYKKDNLVDVGYKDKEGNPILLNHDSLVFEYLNLASDDNLNHLARGGTTFPDYKKLYSRKSKKEIYGNGIRTGNVDAEITDIERQMNDAYEDEDYNVLRNLANNKATILEQRKKELKQIRKNIEKELTDYDKRLIKAWKEVRDISTEMLNEYWVKTYGYENFTESDYWHIETDPNFIKGGDGGNLQQVITNLSESGAVISRQEGAGNPIISGSALFQIDEYINDVAKRIAYSGLQRDLNAVFKHKLPGYENVQSTLQHKMPKVADNFVTIQQSIFGGRANDKGKGERAIATLRGLSARSVLSPNLRVALAQVPSFLGTYRYTDAKAVTNAWLPKNRVKQSVINKYTPLMNARGATGFSLETADLLQDTNKLVRGLNKADRLAHGWIFRIPNKMDTWTVRHTFSAYLDYARRNYPDLEEGTKEQIENGESPLYKKAAELFNEGTMRTQPMFNVFNRNAWQLSDNEFAKTLTVFHTQPFQYLNLITQDIMEYKYEKENGGKDVKSRKNKVLKSIASVLVANSLFVLMKLAVDKTVRHKDDEMESDYIAEQLFSSYANMFILGSTAVDGLYNLIKNGRINDFEIYGTGTINALYDFAEATAGVIDGKSIDYKKNILEVLGGLGIPASNIEKDIGGVFKNIEDFIDNGEWDYSNEKDEKELLSLYILGDYSIKDLNKLGVKLNDDNKVRFSNAVETLYVEGEITKDEAFAKMKESNLFHPNNNYQSDDSFVEGKIERFDIKSYKDAYISSLSGGKETAETRKIISEIEKLPYENAFASNPDSVGHKNYKTPHQKLINYIRTWK